MICWIFDLDGVVTHLTEKKITNPKLLDYFAKFLQKEDVVTINTGRGIPFIHKEVLTPLLEHLIQQNLPEALLNNFFAVGEKGNGWIEDEKHAFDTSTKLPEAFVKKVQERVEKDFSDTMFFDTTKKTMISTQMHTGHSIDSYTPSQQKLIDLFETMLKEEGLNASYHIDPTLTAVDIQANSAGKALGTERIFSWIEKKNFAPDKFIAFGDSKADLDTGHALEKARKAFDFVFVGEKDLIPALPTFPIIFTKEKYDEGVVEYLSSFSN